ncbi:WGR domain-containing protein [Priestia flexa]|uniref:WGR domain-containing protein n=1 Tax=Bacillaceae TaxID=186817 RepID=UPI002E167350
MSVIKMLKEVNGELLYWEVWEDEKTLLIHYGRVGDAGETQEKKLSRLHNAEKLMEALAEAKVDEGYDYIDEDELIELVVQYSYEDGEMEEVLDKRHHVEDLMNECLGWTGNGFCDGGDIGSGTANIVNYVIDPEKATQTIIEDLEKNNLLEGAKIAYLDDDSDEYVALYPEGEEFELI